MSTKNITGFNDNNGIFYLAGYHDFFTFPFEELKEYPCFNEETTFFIELTEKCRNLIDYINEELTAKKNLNYLRNEFEAGLHTLGLSHIVSENNANIIMFKPKEIVLCGSEERMDLKNYHNERDTEIKNIIQKELKRIKGNSTALIGNQHAWYIANELYHPHMVLYDFRPEQSKHSRFLYDLITKEKKNCFNFTVIH